VINDLNLLAAVSPRLFRLVHDGFIYELLDDGRGQLLDFRRVAAHCIQKLVNAVSRFFLLTYLRFQNVICTYQRACSASSFAAIFWNG
jgi:hypothetical protein